MKKNAQLIEEINDALTDLAWGSVEIYVQDNIVTQITVKNIKKTRVSPKSSKSSSENIKNKPQVLTNKKEKYINVYNN
ncbi:MAG: DUF2292 domain-containing protein [Patescibacteria group bacterium]